MRLLFCNYFERFIERVCWRSTSGQKVYAIIIEYFSSTHVISNQKKKLVCQIYYLKYFFPPDFTNTLFLPQFYLFSKSIRNWVNCESYAQFSTNFTLYSFMLNTRIHLHSNTHSSCSANANWQRVSSQKLNQSILTKRSEMVHAKKRVHFHENHQPPTLKKRTQLLRITNKKAEQMIQHKRNWNVKYGKTEHEHRNIACNDSLAI